MQNFNIFGLLGETIKGCRPILHILRATFASQIVCLYRKPLKSYKASKLTMLKNTQKNIFL